MHLEFYYKLKLLQNQSIVAVLTFTIAVLVSKLIGFLAISAFITKPNTQSGLKVPEETWKFLFSLKVKRVFLCP